LLNRGENANRVISKLTGTEFANGTLRIVLPSAVTLDDFNSIRVRAIGFNENFGEVGF